jgi:ribosome-binding factor A
MEISEAIRMKENIECEINELISRAINDFSKATDLTVSEIKVTEVNVINAGKQFILNMEVRL